MDQKAKDARRLARVFGQPGEHQRAPSGVHIFGRRLIRQTSKLNWAIGVVRAWRNAMETGVTPTYPPEPKAGRPPNPWRGKR